MNQVTQTRLPGVGTKFSIPTSHGGRLAVIQHNDGMRESYFFQRRDDGGEAGLQRRTGGFQACFAAFGQQRQQASLRGRKLIWIGGGLGEPQE